METPNEKIYREMLEQIILRIEYGNHGYTYMGVCQEVARVFNDAPVVVVHNPLTRAVGLQINPQ